MAIRGAPSTPIFSFRRPGLVLALGLLAFGARGESWPQPDWQLDPQPPDQPADTFAALGHWGQALYVAPLPGS